MMTGYDPYDPYRDDRRDRPYDPDSPYQEPPAQRYGDEEQVPPWDQQSAPPWERPTSPGRFGEVDSPGWYSGGEHGPGGEPTDAPPFLRSTGGDRYEGAVSDPNATQAYSPVDPSVPAAPRAGGERDAPPFWDGLDAPPAPPRPERREPSGGGYWDRIAEAPSAYASSPDREPIAGRPPADRTEAYSPVSPPSPGGSSAAGPVGGAAAGAAAAGAGAAGYSEMSGYPSDLPNGPMDSPYGREPVDSPYGREPMESPYGREPMESPYGREPVDSPYRDSPWDRPGSGYAQSGPGFPETGEYAADARYGNDLSDGGAGYSAYSDAPYGGARSDDPGYENGSYDNRGYDDGYGHAGYDRAGYDRTAYHRPEPGNQGYTDAGYTDGGYSDAGYGGAGYGAGYGGAGYGGAGYGGAGYPDVGYGGSPYAGAGYPDAPSSDSRHAGGDATQAFSMPFDDEPTDTPPEGYGPRAWSSGQAGRSNDPYGAEPTDAPPAGMPPAPAGGMDVMPGAAPDALAPPAAPGRPPAGPYAPATGRHDPDGPPGAMPPATDTDEFGDVRQDPSGYDPQPLMPRRVDLPDEVLAPLGTGGRRLLDENGEPVPDRAEPRSPYGRGDPADPADRRSRTQDQEAASDQDTNDTPATIGIWVGVVVGLGVAAAAALDVSLPSLLGTMAATVVAWMLTMVLVRRGLGLDWWVSGLAGAVPGALVLGGAFAPDWFRTLTVLYVAASAGAAAVVLTKPVRRLSELVLEYVVAVGVAFAGGGAVAGLLDGEPIGLGLPSVAIALGFGLTLAVATRAQARLGSVSASRTDLLVYGGLVLAATVGAGSLAVLLGAGDGTLGSIAERVEDAILDFRLIVIIPLALLGSAVVVRAFTPAGWWICAVAALSTTAMASSFAGTGDGRLDIAPTLASSFVGYVLGFLVTVGVAFLIGLRMRSASARRSRGGKTSRYVDEPGRLGTF